MSIFTLWDTYYLFYPFFSLAPLGYICTYLTYYLLTSRAQTDGITQQELATRQDKTTKRKSAPNSQIRFLVQCLT